MKLTTKSKKNKRKKLDECLRLLIDKRHFLEKLIKYHLDRDQHLGATVLTVVLTYVNSFVDLASFKLGSVPVQKNRNNEYFRDTFIDMCEKARKGNFTNLNQQVAEQFLSMVREGFRVAETTADKLITFSRENYLPFLELTFYPKSESFKVVVLRESNNDLFYTFSDICKAFDKIDDTCDLVPPYNNNYLPNEWTKKSYNEKKKSNARSNRNVGTLGTIRSLRENLKSLMTDMGELEGMMSHLETPNTFKTSEGVGVTCDEECRVKETLQDRINNFIRAKGLRRISKEFNKSMNDDTGENITETLVDVIEGDEYDDFSDDDHLGMETDEKRVRFTNVEDFFKDIGSFDKIYERLRVRKKRGRYIWNSFSRKNKNLINYNGDQIIPNDLNRIIKGCMTKFAVSQMRNIKNGTDARERFLTQNLTRESSEKLRYAMMKYMTSLVTFFRHGGETATNLMKNIAKDQGEYASHLLDTICQDYKYLRDHLTKDPTLSLIRNGNETTTEELENILINLINKLGSTDEPSIVEVDSTVDNEETNVVFDGILGFVFRSFVLKGEIDNIDEDDVDISRIYSLSYPHLDEILGIVIEKLSDVWKGEIERRFQKNGSSVATTTKGFLTAYPYVIRFLFSLLNLQSDYFEEKIRIVKEAQEDLINAIITVTSNLMDTNSVLLLLPLTYMSLGAYSFQSLEDFTKVIENIDCIVFPPVPHSTTNKSNRSNRTDDAKKHQPIPGCRESDYIPREVARFSEFPNLRKIFFSSLLKPLHAMDKEGKTTFKTRTGETSSVSDENVSSSKDSLLISSDRDTKETVENFNSDPSKFLCLTQPLEAASTFLRSNKQGWCVANTIKNHVKHFIQPTSGGLNNINIDKVSKVTPWIYKGDTNSTKQDIFNLGDARESGENIAHLHSIGEGDTGRGIDAILLKCVNEISDGTEKVNKDLRKSLNIAAEAIALIEEFSKNESLRAKAKEVRKRLSCYVTVNFKREEECGYDSDDDCNNNNRSNKDDDVDDCQTLKLLKRLGKGLFKNRIGDDSSEDFESFDEDTETEQPPARKKLSKCIIKRARDKCVVQSCPRTNDTTEEYDEIAKTVEETPNLDTDLDTLLEGIDTLEGLLHFLRDCRSCETSTRKITYSLFDVLLSKSDDESIDLYIFNLASVFLSKYVVNEMDIKNKGVLEVYEKMLALVGDGKYFELYIVPQMRDVLKKENVFSTILGNYIQGSNFLFTRILEAIVKNKETTNCEKNMKSLKKLRRLTRILDVKQGFFRKQRESLSSSSLLVKTKNKYEKTLKNFISGGASQRENDFQHQLNLYEKFCNRSFNWSPSSSSSSSSSSSLSSLSQSSLSSSSSSFYFSLTSSSSNRDDDNINEKKADDGDAGEDNDDNDFTNNDGDYVVMFSQESKNRIIKNINEFKDLVNNIYKIFNETNGKPCLKDLFVSVLYPFSSVTLNNLSDFIDRVHAKWRVLWNDALPSKIKDYGNLVNFNNPLERVPASQKPKYTDLLLMAACALNRDYDRSLPKRIQHALDSKDKLEKSLSNIETGLLEFRKGLIRKEKSVTKLQSKRFEFVDALTNIVRPTAFINVTKTHWGSLCTMLLANSLNHSKDPKIIHKTVAEKQSSIKSIISSSLSLKNLASVDVVDNIWASGIGERKEQQRLSGVLHRTDSHLRNELVKTVLDIVGEDWCESSQRGDSNIVPRVTLKGAVDLSSPKSDIKYHIVNNTFKEKMMSLKKYIRTLEADTYFDHYTHLEPLYKGGQRRYIPALRPKLTNYIEWSAIFNIGGQIDGFVLLSQNPSVFINSLENIKKKLTDQQERVDISHSVLERLTTHTSHDQGEEASTRKILKLILATMRVNFRLFQSSNSTLDEMAQTRHTVTRVERFLTSEDSSHGNFVRVVLGEIRRRYAHCFKLTESNQEAWVKTLRDNARLFLGHLTDIMSQALKLQKQIRTGLSENCQLLKCFVNDRDRRRYLLGVLRENTVNEILQRGLDGSVFSFRCFRNDRSDTEILKRFGNIIRNRFEEPNNSPKPIIRMWDTKFADPRYMGSKISANIAVNRNFKPFPPEDSDTDTEDDLSFFLPQLEIDKLETSIATSLIELSSMSNYLNYNTRRLLNTLTTSTENGLRSFKTDPSTQEEPRESSIEELGEKQMEEATAKKISKMIDIFNRLISRLREINIDTLPISKIFDVISLTVAEGQIVAEEIDALLVENVDGDDIKRGHRYLTVLMEYDDTVSFFNESKKALISEVVRKRDAKFATKLKDLEKVHSDQKNLIQRQYEKAKSELDKTKIEIATKLSSKRMFLNILKDKMKDTLLDKGEMEKVMSQHHGLEQEIVSLNIQLDDIINKRKINEKQRLEKLDLVEMTNERTKIDIERRETSDTYYLISALNNMKLTLSHASRVLVTLARTVSSRLGYSSDCFKAPTTADVGRSGNFKCFLEPLHNFKMGYRRGRFEVASLICRTVCENCISLLFDLETSKIRTRNNFIFNNTKKMKDIKDVYLHLINASTKEDANLSKTLLESGPNAIMSKLGFDTIRTVLVYRPSLQDEMKDGTILLPTSELFDCLGKNYNRHRHKLSESCDAHLSRNTWNNNTLTAHLSAITPNTDVLFFPRKDERESFSSIRNVTLQAGDALEYTVGGSTCDKLLHPDTHNYVGPSELQRPEGKDVSANVERFDLDLGASLTCAPLSALNSQCNLSSINHQLRDLNKRIFCRQKESVEETSVKFANRVANLVTSLNGGTHRANAAVIGEIQAVTMEELRKQLGLSYVESNLIKTRGSEPRDSPYVYSTIEDMKTKTRMRMTDKHILNRIKAYRLCFPQMEEGEECPSSGNTHGRVNFSGIMKLTLDNIMSSNQLSKTYKMLNKVEQPGSSSTDWIGENLASSKVSRKRKLTSVDSVGEAFFPLKRLMGGVFNSLMAASTSTMASEGTSGEGTASSLWSDYDSKKIKEKLRNLGVDVCRMKHFKLSRLERLIDLFDENNIHSISLDHLKGKRRYRGFMPRLYDELMRHNSKNAHTSIGNDLSIFLMRSNICGRSLSGGNGNETLRDFSKAIRTLYKRDLNFSDCTPAVSGATAKRIRTNENILQTISSTPFLAQYLLVNKLNEISGFEFPKGVMAQLRERLKFSDAMGLYNDRNEFLSLVHKIVAEDTIVDLAFDRTVGTQYHVKGMKNFTGLVNDAPNLVTNFTLLSQGIMNRDKRHQTNSTFCDSFLQATTDKTSTLKNIMRCEALEGRLNDFTYLTTEEFCICPYKNHHSVCVDDISKYSRATDSAEVRRTPYRSQKNLAKHDYLRTLSVVDTSKSRLGLQKDLAVTLGAGYGSSYLKKFTTNRSVLDSLVFEPCGVNNSVIVNPSNESRVLSSRMCYHKDFCASDYKASAASAMNRANLEAPTNSLEPTRMILAASLNPKLGWVCNALCTELIRTQNKIMDGVKRRLEKVEFDQILGRNALEYLKDINLELKKVVRRNEEYLEKDLLGARESSAVADKILKLTRDGKRNMGRIERDIIMNKFRRLLCTSAAPMSEDDEGDYGDEKRELPAMRGQQPNTLFLLDDDYAATSSSLDAMIDRVADGEFNFNTNLSFSLLSSSEATSESGDKRSARQDLDQLVRFIYHTVKKKVEPAKLKEIMECFNESMEIDNDGDWMQNVTEETQRELKSVMTFLEDIESAGDCCNEGNEGRATRSQEHSFLVKFKLFTHTFDNAIMPYLKSEKESVKHIFNLANALVHLENFLAYGLSNFNSFDLSHLGTDEIYLEDSMIFKILDPLLLFAFHQPAAYTYLKEIETKQKLVEERQLSVAFFNHPDTSNIVRTAECIIGKGGSGVLGIGISTLVQVMSAAYSLDLSTIGDDSACVPRESDRRSVEKNRTPLLTIPDQNSMIQVSMPTQSSGLVTNTSFKGEKWRPVYLHTDAVLPVLDTLAHTDMTVDEVDTEIQTMPEAFDAFRMAVSGKNVFDMFVPEGITFNASDSHVSIKDLRRVISKMVDEGVAKERCNILSMINVSSPVNLFMNSTIFNTPKMNQFLHRKLCSDLKTFVEEASGGRDGLEPGMEELDTIQGLLAEIRENVERSTQSVRMVNETFDEDPIESGGKERSKLQTENAISMKLIEELNENIEEVRPFYVAFDRWKNQILNTSSNGCNKMLSPTSFQTDAILNPSKNILASLLLGGVGVTVEERQAMAALRVAKHNPYNLVFRDYECILNPESVNSDSVFVNQHKNAYKQFLKNGKFKKNFLKQLADVFNQNTFGATKYTPDIFEDFIDSEQTFFKFAKYIDNHHLVCGPIQDLTRKLLKRRRQEERMALDTLTTPYNNETTCGNILANNSMFM